MIYPLWSCAETLYGFGGLSCENTFANISTIVVGLMLASWRILTYRPRLLGYQIRKLFRWLIRYCDLRLKVKKVFKKRVRDGQQRIKMWSESVHCLHLYLNLIGYWAWVLLEIRCVCFHYCIILTTTKWYLYTKGAMCNMSKVMPNK